MHSFSIAIPAYKNQYLKDAIDSILSQTYDKFEIIIVNDASPYSVREVVDKYNDSRIRYFENKTNCGAVNVVDNWNICLSYAKCEYIICMGDDDRLLPCCLEEYVNLMSKYPNLGVYHAWTELIDENSNFIDLQQPRPEYETALSLVWNRWNGRNKQYIGDFCYNVKLLRKNGGFYKLPLAWGTDDISAVRAAAIGGIANTQVLCFQYRVNRQTITQIGNAKTKVMAILEEKRWFDNFLDLQEKRIDLSPLDSKYLKCLTNEIYLHYKDKIKITIIMDLKSNILNIYYWYRKAHIYNISKKDIFICLIKALK